MTQDNIIRFEPKPPPEKPRHPPMIDLPKTTKILTFSIIATHIILWLGSYFIAGFPIERIYMELGFISARWTGALPFSWMTPLSLVSVNFLHGGWFHLAINAVTIVAFGAGVEKRMGAKSMLVIFFATSAIALLTHLAISPFSLNPVIGASGGISGLFGAVLVMLKHDGRLGNENQKILPMALLWIAITFVFGIMGAPDGNSIAWVAHIGGFIGGLALGFMMTRRP